SSDPIRDGTNWYLYCSADPINYVDQWGLKMIKPISLNMQNSEWGEQITGDPSLQLTKSQINNNQRDISFISENGCYLTGYSEAAITLTGNDYTPSFFNQYTYLFDSNQNFNSTKASEITGLKNDYWTKNIQGDLTNKLNELDSSKTQYVVMAQIPYTSTGKLHWVSVYGSVNEDGFINVIGTSKNDVKGNSLREQSGSWDFTNGVRIKASDIQQLRTFRKGD
ncbi:MAG: hypothetical protein MJ184_09570, partial [Treponema sp.]|uniref:hypothetical protein n=1 Tax=Treponema sp. TaxID=166 RepID=UPI00298E67AA